MNRDKLKRTVEEIEAAETAIKDLSAHKRELYAGVKDEFEPKVLRKIIQRRKMDPESRTKDDDLLDQYETALGMTENLARAVVAGDLTYDEAAEKADVSRRTMARHVARVKGVPKATGNGAHDPETGEIETAPGWVEPAPGGPATGGEGRCGPDGSPTKAVLPLPQPDPCSTDGHSTRDAAPEGRFQFPPHLSFKDNGEAVALVDPPSTPPLGAVGSDIGNPDADKTVGDNLDLPPFLDRRNGLPPAQKPEECSGRTEGTQ